MFARDPVSREGENMSKPTLYCFTPADPRWRPLLVGEARGIKAMAMWQKATAVRMWGSEDAREILVDELLDEGSSVVVQLHDGKSLMQFHFGDSFPMATYDPNVESLHPIWWDLAGSFGEHLMLFMNSRLGCVASLLRCSTPVARRPRHPRLSASIAFSVLRTVRGTKSPFFFERSPAIVLHRR